MSDDLARRICSPVGIEFGSLGRQLDASFEKTYQSTDKSSRLTVTPGHLKSALSYFEEKVEGREPAGAPTGSKARSATATLERRSARDRWENVWNKPLAKQLGGRRSPSWVWAA